MKLLIQHTTPIQLQISINMLNCSTKRLHAKFQFLLPVKIIINYFQLCIIRIIHNNNKPSFTNHHSRNNHNKNKKEKKKIIQYKIRLCLMFPLQTKSPWSFHFSFQQFYDFFFFFFFGFGYYFNIIFFVF